eukprot:843842_1
MKSLSLLLLIICMEFEEVCPAMQLHNAMAEVCPQELSASKGEVAQAASLVKAGLTHSGGVNKAALLKGGIHITSAIIALVPGGGWVAAPIVSFLGTTAI